MDMSQHKKHFQVPTFGASSVVSIHNLYHSCMKRRVKSVQRSHNWAFIRLLKIYPVISQALQSVYALPARLNVRIIRYSVYHNYSVYCLQYVYFWTVRKYVNLQRQCDR